MGSWVVECECGMETRARNSVEASRKAHRHSMLCFDETTIYETCEECGRRLERNERGVCTPCAKEDVLA